MSQVSVCLPFVKFTVVYVIIPSADLFVDDSVWSLPNTFSQSSCSRLPRVKNVLAWKHTGTNLVKGLTHPFARAWLCISSWICKPRYRMSWELRLGSRIDSSEFQTGSFLMAASKEKAK